MNKLTYDNVLTIREFKRGDKKHISFVPCHRDYSVEDIISFNGTRYIIYRETYSNARDEYTLLAKEY